MRLEYRVSIPDKVQFWVKNMHLKEAESGSTTPAAACKRFTSSPSMAKCSSHATQEEKPHLALQRHTGTALATVAPHKSQMALPSLETQGALHQPQVRAPSVTT